MRENRTSGSEGREKGNQPFFLTPIPEDTRRKREGSARRRAPVRAHLVQASHFVNRFFTNGVRRVRE